MTWLAVPLTITFSPLDSILPPILTTRRYYAPCTPMRAGCSTNLIHSFQGLFPLFHPERLPPCPIHPTSVPFPCMANLFTDLLSIILRAFSGTQSHSHINHVSIPSALPQRPLFLLLYDRYHTSLSHTTKFGLRAAIWLPILFSVHLMFFLVYVRFHGLWCNRIFIVCTSSAHPGCLMGDCP